MYQEIVFKLEYLGSQAEGLSSAGIRTQFTVGDFHLKTLVGLITGQALLINEFVDLKLTLLDRKPLLSCFELNKNIFLNSIQSSSEAIAELEVLLMGLLESVRDLQTHVDGFYWDTEMYWGLQKFESIFSKYHSVLCGWQSLGVTERSELRSHSGLLRDCDIKEVLLADLTEQSTPISLTDKDLFDPMLRSAYLCSNAYLEISAIEIISDLILQAGHFKALPKWARMGLAYQLIDECQHAELLASRVESLGFELGIVQVSTHTWDCYQSFSGLAEKIVAQQVVQEGVGLDSSAINIKRFLKVQDLETSSLYEKITADELNHVSLGVKLLKYLEPTNYNEVYQETLKKVQQIDPLPNVPEFVELKRKAGFERSWFLSPTGS